MEEKSLNTFDYLNEKEDLKFFFRKKLGYEKCGRKFSQGHFNLQFNPPGFLPSSEKQIPRKIFEKKKRKLALL